MQCGMVHFDEVGYFRREQCLQICFEIKVIGIAHRLVQARLLAAFRRCSFSPDSPERDFAEIEFRGKRVWLKVDYYDEAVEYGSPDPANASITTRVITIVLPEDY